MQETLVGSQCHIQDSVAGGMLANMVPRSTFNVAVAAKEKKTTVWVEAGNVDRGLTLEALILKKKNNKFYLYPRNSGSLVDFWPGGRRADMVRFVFENHSSCSIENRLMQVEKGSIPFWRLSEWIKERKMLAWIRIEVEKSRWMQGRIRRKNRWDLVKESIWMRKRGMKNYPYDSQGFLLGLVHKWGCHSPKMRRMRMF